MVVRWFYAASSGGVGPNFRFLGVRRRGAAVNSRSVGTPIVLLPGLDGTGRLFERFLGACPPGLEPLPVHLPEDGDQRHGALAERLAHELPRGGRWLLLGESFSGPLAVRIAAAEPSGLAGVVLCATFVRSPFTPWLVRAGSRVAGRGSPPLWALRRWLTGGDGALAAEVRAALDTVPASTVRSRLRAIADVDVTGDLASLGTPTLALSGTRDRLVPPRCTRAMQRAAPSLETARAEAPHLVLQTRSRWAWERICERFG